MKSKSDVKVLRVRGVPYYGQVFETETGGFFGMVWDDYDVNILQTQAFDEPEQIWESVRQVFRYDHDELEGWYIPKQEKKT